VKCQICGFEEAERRCPRCGRSVCRFDWAGEHCVVCAKLSAGFVEETSQLPPVSFVGDLCARNVVYGGGWGEYVKIV